MSTRLKLVSVIFIGGILLFPPSHGFSLTSISNSLRDFGSGLFENAGSFIKNKTESFWNNLSEKEMLNLGGKNIQDLLNDRENGRIPMRVKETLEQIFKRNLTLDEIKIKLKNAGSSLADYESLMFLKKLPPPRDWNLQNVTDMFTPLKNAPNSLMLQVMNSDALNYIKSRLRDVNVGLDRNLFRKMHGRADTWTNETFRNMELKKIPGENWNFIRPEVLASRRTEIINTALYLEDKNSADILLQKLLEIDDLKSQDDPTIAMNIASNLGSLKDLLMPEDFNERILDNEEISNLLDANIKIEAENEMLSFEGSKRVIKKFGKMENINSETVGSDEIVELGLALPTNLSAIIKAISIDSATNVNKLLEGARNLPGLGFEAKAEILVSAILNASDSSSISVQNYDEELWPLFPGFILEKLEEGSSAEVLKKNADFTKNQIQILLNKISKSGLGTLSRASRELIPISRMKDFDPGTYEYICKDLAPGSVVTMKYADSSLDGVTEIVTSNWNDFAKLLPFIGKKEAMLFNQSMIMDILKLIKEVNPPSSACITLKDKVINYTRSMRRDFNENNPMSYLLDREFSQLPLCVLASYGTYALSSLKADQSILLLSRLGKAKDIDLSIPRNVRMAIIEEGLAKLGTRTGLELGDLEVIGNAIADIPAREMKNIDDGIAYDFIMNMNNLIEMKNGRKPCLDKDQMNAIAEMIKKVKRTEPSSWYNIRDICCLMFTLSKNDLDKIDDGVILTCSCKSPNPSVTQKMIDDMCQSSLESDTNLMLEGEMRFENRKMEASIKILAEITAELREDKSDAEKQESEMNSRRKRETMKDDVCNKASLGGAAAFSLSEILSLESEVVVSCIAFFGASNMTQEKAEALARKIREVKNDFTMMKNRDIVSLGFIMKGFSSTDYRDFPSFRKGDFDETVEMLGKMKGFSSSQVKKLALKIKDSWVSPASMTAPEVMMVNNLICGYESADISAISEETIKGSISVFADLECSRETLDDLARAVKRAYGDIATWGRGEVAEMGGLIGSLIPEELMKIPPESMEGLTKTGIQKITTDGIRAMSLAQVSFINPLASVSLSAEQKSAMTPEMMNALKKTTVDTRRKSGSDAVTPLVTTILLPLLFIIF